MLAQETQCYQQNVCLDGTRKVGIAKTLFIRDALQDTKLGQFTLKFMKQARPQEAENDISPTVSRPGA